MLEGVRVQVQAGSKTSLSSSSTKPWPNDASTGLENQTLYDYTPLNSTDPPRSQASPPQRRGRRGTNIASEGPPLMTSPTNPPAVSRAKYRRTPYLVVSQEHSVRKDVYGAVDHNVVRQAQLLRGDRDSDTVIVRPQGPMELLGRHRGGQRVDLPEANHYFSGEDQQSHVSRAADHIHDFLSRHGLT